MSEALAQYLGWMAGRRQGNAQIWPDDNPVGTQTVQQMSAATPLGAEIAPGSMPTTRRDGTVPTAGMLTNPLLGPAVQQAANNALMFSPGTIRAYHGSPHKFDRFDPKYIGTGEGAQAYGRGLYFAGDEAIARSYRDKLTRMRGGEKVGMPDGRWFSWDYSAPLDESMARNAVRQYSGDFNAALIGVKDPKVASIIEGWINSGAKYVPPPKGYMYEVDLKVAPERLLDIDLPLMRQGRIGEIANEIRPAKPWYVSLSPTGKRAQVMSPGNWVTNGNPGWYSPAKAQQIVDDYNSRTTGLGRTGADIVRDRGVNGQKTADQLQGAGIPGIRYLDGASRAAGQGSHNYVMFDPDLIEIVRRYGIAGLLGSGAVAAQGAPEQ